MQKIKTIKWATTLKIKRKKGEKTARKKNGEIDSSKKTIQNLLRVFKNIRDHACGHDLYNERNLQSTCE